MDSLATNVSESSPLVFCYVQEETKPIAAIVGFEHGNELEIRWALSAQAGEGIKLIKDVMNKYDKITLKAAPYGHIEEDAEIQLDKIVGYYETLGFNKIKDFEDDKYGGTIPMVWQYNKLSGFKG